MSDGARIGALTGHTHGILSVAFSPDRATLVSGGLDATVRQWKVSDRTLVRNYCHHTSGVSSVAFTRDGQTVASGSGDRTIRFWQASEGSSIFS